MSQQETLIIGGGLAGLYAAWHLHRRGEPFVLLEARGRLGGRVKSGMVVGASFDLGPAWFWPDFQPRLPRLLAELGLSSFSQWTDGAIMFEPRGGAPQSVPPQPGDPGSMRISGGTSALIAALGDAIPEENICLNAPVSEVSLSDDGVSVKTAEETLQGARALLCLPPRLAAERIRFDPALPDGVTAWARVTPTWMAGHAKFLAVYDRPFWRDQGLSGQAFSYQGPMMEIHDASPENGSELGALFGFLGVPAPQRREAGADAVKAAARDQLVRLFGPEAGPPQAILYKDWSEDAFTAVTADDAPPSGHPAYGLPSDVSAMLDPRIIFAGTEAAPTAGGYLEGCLEAVDRALDRTLPRTSAGASESI